MATPKLTRRGFVGSGLSLGLTLLAGHSALGQDASPQTPAAGGGDRSRLFDPSAVQERRPTVAADNDAALMALEKRLKCQCGCNLDIYTCRTTDFTCTTSPALHREIVALQNQGRSAQEILDAFVQEYGEQALMAPKPEGFNLAGYFVPGALMLLGVTALTLWIMRRQRQVALVSAGTPGPDVDAMAAAGATPEEIERLRRALAEVED
jgi:cytochrome c-type biogenesis protein CcmH